MADIYQTFHVGINIFAVRDGKLLLGKRKNIFGAGTWGLPGGHLEIGEEVAAAAARELMEETGLKSESYQFSNIVNYPSGEKQYLQIGYVAECISGEPELKEADRCEEWKWWSLDTLPEEIFPPHVKQVQNFLNSLNNV